MSSERPHTPAHLFAVRLWCEDLGDGQIRWRGQVTHVLSGEAYYFRERRELETHLMAMALLREQASEAETIQTSGY